MTIHMTTGRGSMSSATSATEGWPLYLSATASGWRPNPVAASVVNVRNSDVVNISFPCPDGRTPCDPLPPSYAEALVRR